MAKKKNGRYSEKRSSKRGLLLALIGVLVVLIGGMILWIRLNPEQQTDPKVDTPLTTEAEALPGEETQSTTEGAAQATEGAPEQEQPAEEPTEQDDGIPCTMEDGKLEISSLFQYSGMNPDCYWEMGEDIAGIVMHNRSEQHLTVAKITLELSDGTVLQYEIYDIPAGKTVWAYDINNNSYNGDAACVAVKCSAEFADATELMADKLNFTVSGMDISVTNNSAEQLTNLMFVCHAVLDDVYFGGMAYEYCLPELAPGATETVVAADCFLDTAEVVFIYN